MAQTKKKSEELEEDIGLEGEGEAVEPTAEELLKKIEELEAALKEKDDRYLRLAAEYDNFRRRSREEKEAIYADALSDTVSEILPIIDNLDRAALYEDGEQVKSGLVMIAKSVDTVFEKLGIEPMGKVGDTFELKVSAVDLLPNVKDTLLQSITITIQSEFLNEDTADDLITMLKESPGKTDLYIQIKDGEGQHQAHLKSKSVKISANNKLINYIKSLEGVEYKFN